MADGDVFEPCISLCQPRDVVRDCVIETNGAVVDRNADERRYERFGNGERGLRRVVIGTVEVLLVNKAIALYHDEGRGLGGSQKRAEVFVRAWEWQ